MPEQTRICSEFAIAGSCAVSTLAGRTLASRRDPEANTEGRHGKDTCGEREPVRSRLRSRFAGLAFASGRIGLSFVGRRLVRSGLFVWWNLRISGLVLCFGLVAGLIEIRLRLFHGITTHIHG